MSSNDGHHIDIVMLPFMAHGHLIPFLALANQIHLHTGFNIAIANTPLNIQYLHQQNSPPWIHLLELPFSSSDHGLPPNTEHTEDLPLDQIGTLVISSVSLKTPFHNLLLDILQKQGRPPRCIISDLFFGWVVDVAQVVNTVNITFATSGAYGYLAYVSCWLNLPHRKTDDEEFDLPGFPETFEEIEPLGLDLLRKYTKLPVWPIGPLLPKQLLSKSPLSATVQRVAKSPGISAEKCVQWLDMHGVDSVLYISFGSQNTVSPQSITHDGTGNWAGKEYETIHLGD
ncbi:hypothetical protein V6N13_047204 [Hibiscus sabdariffa]